MMKRTILIPILLFVSLLSFGQSKDITIYWDNPSKIFSEKETAAIKRDRLLSRINLQLDGDEILFQKKWVDKGFANSSTVKISNTKWAVLTSEELKKVNTEKIPSNLNFTLQSSKARELIYTNITISPIVKVNGQYQKLLSFTVSYSYGTPPQSSARMAITNSVLATGEWYRFKIDKTGVYKVDKAFLNSLGMNTNGINPRNIKIYGFGGKPLPLQNDQNTIFDPLENAIQVIGEEDGVFDSGDYILFYGIGNFGYDLENDSNLNPYSDETYYFVTVGDSPGLRVQPMIEPTDNPETIITDFHDEQFFEEDEFSPAKVGRQWFGNRFDVENEQQFEFAFPNIVSGAPMRVQIFAAASSEIATSMAISVNSTSLDPLIFSPIDDPLLLTTATRDVTVTASGENVIVDLVYNNAGNPASIGYLNYIKIEALRSLTGGNGQLSFRNKNSAPISGIGEYQISNATQFSQVWDVTNPQLISSKQNEGNAASFSFKAILGEIREYVAVAPNNYFVPVKGGNSQVANQNLKGAIFKDAAGNFKDIDYIIISPPVLIQPALRLANHHKNTTGLNVKVVTTDKIYNEFGSGIQDISAIRNFVRYVYENASSEDKRIKYVCLFGDTSVDYKDRLPENNNMVPTFQTLDSRSTFRSFMSDDFFGLMDPAEGVLDVPQGGNQTLDIAVGRILADEVSLANTMVDKIIDYSSKESYGNWRNNFVLVSDDVDVDWEYSRLEVTLDAIGDQITAEKPYINVRKIHADAFQQETSAGGNRYPQVNEAIVNGLEVGSLIINYFGHGGEDGLAKEFIFTKQTGQDLRNTNKYTCFVTVTCEFTKFDNPQRITAGELVFWNREGGAVAMITTTRSIGVELGVDFNEILAEDLFGFGLDVPVPPAEAVRLTKNELSNNNKRVIFYIGDPAMALAIPKQSTRITALNDQPISQATDTLKALSKVKFAGEVLDTNGNLLSNYNGVLQAKVFDKDVQRQTLGNDGIRDGNGQLLILDFKTLGEVIFNGQATVANGRFEFEFVVPRDIQIPVGNGKVSLYAERNGVLEDQTGFNLDILVGGINENAPSDIQGPNIQLFMNDESFVSGGITNDSPILLAKLEDENGINTASGIGHDLTAILDGDEANPFVMNEYYIANVDDYTKGKSNYKFRDLEEGLHTLTVKAWDVYNNSSTAEIQFVVAGDDKLKIERVLNYPNPFVNYTEFWFNHNRPFEPLEVQVQVFTVTGKVVWTQNQIITTDGFLSRDIVWDGKDDFGDRIGKGVYVYKLTVKSTLTGNRVEKYEKLVIL
ncbi:MAG: type IX secretion system sortase PorU [Flavobacteriaceae bacterium]